ncbi:hypothetical protein ACFPOA_03695 [Lysobacter niabensis]|uniref:hypothetical protein n=1 Tax=Agrilutibacter niabensis TaxID=380628 RepID=UPI00360E8129
MHKHLILLATLLACASCQQQSPSAPAEQPPAATSTAAPAPAQATEKEPVKADAVSGLVAKLGDRVAVRYDRMNTKADGKAERQVFMEVVNGTLAEAEADVAEQLVAAGYIVGRRTEDKNGARQLFRMRGGDPVRTLARPKGVGPALKDDRAVGSIYLKH